jgi:hypothetical protein
MVCFEDSKNQNDKYDTETLHSQKKEAQAKWQDSVQLELKKTDSWFGRNILIKRQERAK